jgi:leader peptidase (prepilin peptidase) / N-methyltransferase
VCALPWMSGQVLPRLMPELPVTSYPILLVFLFAVGATVGSFLNVCIFRIPESESIVHPPSHCMSCGARLRFIDLIPVLSALIFRFRCRYCGHRYSWQYPLVEALTGAYFVTALLVKGPSVEAVVAIVAACALLVLFFIDLRHLIIPDGLSAIILICGLVLDGWRLWEWGWRKQAIVFPQEIAGRPHTLYLPQSVLGLLVGAGLFYLISWVAGKVFRKETMGGGDVKLAGAMGAVLGPGYVFFSYALVSIVLGAVIGLALIALRVRSRRDYIPFGPMMAVAGMVMMLWGDAIADKVLALYHL